MIRGAVATRVIAQEVYRVIGEHLGDHLIRSCLWPLHSGGGIRNRAKPIWRANIVLTSWIRIQLHHAEIGFHLGFVIYTCNNRFDLLDRPICICLSDMIIASLKTPRP